MLVNLGNYKPYSKTSLYFQDSELVQKYEWIQIFVTWNIQDTFTCCCFSSSKSVCKIVGGATFGTILSSCKGGWILCSAVIFKRGMILVGTTPSMQDGRRNGWGDSGGVTGSVESIGEEELLVVSFRDPLLEGLESLDLNPPPPPRPLFFLKLRWRLIQLPLGFSHLLRARISGSLLHFSRVRIKVFFRKYFLLWTYLEIASAHPYLPVNLAHSSAHRHLPWSLLFGLAPARKIWYLTRDAECFELAFSVIRNNRIHYFSLHIRRANFCWEKARVVWDPVHWD